MTGLLEGVVEKEIVLRGGKVSEVQFAIGDKDYRAFISPERASLGVASRSGACTSVFASIDHRTSAITWQMRHDCGAGGYDSMQGDSCYACECAEKNRVADASGVIHTNSDAVLTPMNQWHANHYDPKLELLLRSGLAQYCTQIESKLI